MDVRILPEQRNVEVLSLSLDPVTRAHLSPATITLLESFKPDLQRSIELMETDWDIWGSCLAAFDLVFEDLKDAVKAALNSND